MTQSQQGWGAGPTPGYDALASRFRPIFERIREGAVERERERILIFDQIGWLKDAAFTAIRVPAAEGGLGATLPDLFGLLTELAAADSNVVQALRVHFGFVEEVLCANDAGRRERWIPRLLAGQIAGSARSETGNRLAAFDTAVSRDGSAWRLDGRKFYTTGSLYADWIHVAAHASRMTLPSPPSWRAGHAALRSWMIGTASAKSLRRAVPRSSRT